MAANCRLPTLCHAAVMPWQALLAVYPREGTQGLVLTEEQQGALLLAREVRRVHQSEGHWDDRRVRVPCPPYLSTLALSTLAPCPP